LVDVCRYISFSTLSDYLDHVGAVVRYLRPEFLDELSESCALEDLPRITNRRGIARQPMPARTATAGLRVSV
jgi:hypothetical protein